MNEESDVLLPVEPATERRSEQVAEGRGDKRDRKTDERKNRKRSPSPKTEERKSRKRSPSPAKKKRDNQQRSRSKSASPALLKSKPQQQHEVRDRQFGSPVARPFKQSAQGRSKSPRSVSPVTSKKQSKPSRTKHSPSRSRSPTPPPARKQQKSRVRSKSRSVSPVVAFRKRESWGHARSKSPGSPPVQSKKQQQELEYEARSVKRQYVADQSRSRSPVIVKEHRSAPRRESPPAILPMPIDSRGPPPERAQPRRKSRSRSPERDRFVPRDMSSYGPSRRDDGGKQQQHEREQHFRESDRQQPLERKQQERNPRDNDQPFERSRPQPERRGNSGKMSRYGPAGSEIPSNNNGGRDESRNDRQAPKRDLRDSPPRPQNQSILGDHIQGPPRSEQRRGSRSPPRFGSDRNRSKSPQGRRPADGSQRAPAGGDNGGRGGRDRERNEHRTLERKNSGSRRDDRSIAEIAHEEQERIDRLQPHSSRRDSHPPSGGNLSKYGGDAGRGEHFGTPPPLRDGGRPRVGSFQKPRSRSRSPPGRSMQPIQQRSSPNELAPRDRSHQSPLMPPHVRDFNRGLKNSPQFDHQQARTENNMRDSPHLDTQKPRGNNLRDPPPLDLQKRERRESYGGRLEGRRGRSPPPSPLMTASDRRASAPIAGTGEQRRRSRSKTRGRADEREHKGNRRSEKETRASGDQNSRNRANHQGKDSDKGRQQPQQPYSPVLTSPPTGKRLRSLTPSPVRRNDSHRVKTSRERSRSPILKRPAAVTATAAHSDDETPSFAEKRRRIDDDDVLPKPASAAVFDDLDEMMVDYEEDD